MGNIKYPPFCYSCNGEGVTYPNLDRIKIASFFSLVIKTCKTCNGTGINLKNYKVNQYNGEIISYNGRLGIFLKQNHRDTAIILIGKNIQIVSIENVDFLNVRIVHPKKDLSFL
jgi:hypothetical protein